MEDFEYDERVAQRQWQRTVTAEEHKIIMRGARNPMWRYAMTFNVPNLKQTEANDRSFPVWAPGRYTLEFRGMEIHDKDNGKSLQFKFGLIEDLDGKNDREVNGQEFSEFIFIMDPSHPSYEAYGHLGAGDLKFMLDGLGVEIEDDGDFDPEEVISEQYEVMLAVRNPKKKDRENGRDDKTNFIKKFIEQ